MAGPLPIGDPAPADGRLPVGAAVGADSRKFGVYLHVPFCRVRCGYCDFNTFTGSELQGAKQADFAAQAITEIQFAAGVLDRSGAGSRGASTVFFGGGTPTMLPAENLISMLESVRNSFGVAPDAEITTEANPDSVDARYLDALAAAGFTRISFGMQSALPHVLATLDRTHDPRRVPEVVALARSAGLAVSVDLIYGTPGESLADWRISVETALELQPDHLSAYSLIVEDGTALARRIRRGELSMPDDDLAADMYELADDALTVAGFSWYEVSNWSRGVDSRSRHNLAYWQGQDWWGIGPGAHSHVGGVRWWNVKHPAAYGQRITAGESPAAGRESLDAGTRRVERVLLETRLADGLPLDVLDAAGRRAVAGLIADGLVDAASALSGTVRLTRQGRLLADAVVRRLVGA